MAKKRKKAVSSNPKREQDSRSKTSTRDLSAASKKKKLTDPTESSQSGEATADFAVVGLGASAGGLDAFRRFFTAMPDDTGMAFVLIQHLDPTHESFTAELLDKNTGMTVVQARDEMQVEPNHVYVIPPNCYLTISGERLHLTKPVERRGVRVPINFFLRSLAENQQERSIGIILSGTGSDGTSGAREIKAANEEVTSVNEELQSTNEELETSREELQSINEELQTVNTELEAKIDELESTNNDLSNLLTSIDQATVFLDRDFRIRRFTPATTRMLRVIDADIGRPFRDIVQNFSDEDLMLDAETVLSQLAPIEKAVGTSEDHWYVRRIAPYRTEDNRIDGVVITFTDITARKQASDTINEARLYAEGIVETVRESLLVLSDDLRVQSANASFYRTFQAQRKGTEGQLLYDLGNGQWEIPQLRNLLDELLVTDNRVSDFEVTHEFQGIGQRTMLLNARTIRRKAKRPNLILLAIADITSRKQAEKQISVLNESLERQVSERVAELQLAAQDQALLAALVESSSAAIISIRMDGNITHWNDSAHQLFGYSSDEILGKNVRILCPQERQGELDEMQTRLLEDGMVRGFETVRLHRDGTRIKVAMSVSLIQNSEPPQMCSIVTDTRERKRLEERLAEVAEHERRSLGQDLHDTLAQQVTGVGMLTASLRDEIPTGSSADELIDKLEWNIQRMQKQVRTMMVGLMPVDLDGGGLPAALERLAADTTDLFQVACGFVFLDDVPLSNDFVATQLFLIAREATHNAAKHARAGEITIHLTDHNGIRVMISDDGVGMPPDVSESAGMGLPIMNHRAGLIGAELRFESPATGGTIVNCFLPLHAVAEGETMTEPKKSGDE